MHMQLAQILLVLRKEGEPLPARFQDYTLLALIAAAAQLCGLGGGSDEGVAALAMRYQQDYQNVLQVGTANSDAHVEDYQNVLQVGVAGSDAQFQEPACSARRGRLVAETQHPVALLQSSTPAAEAAGDWNTARYAKLGQLWLHSQSVAHGLLCTTTFWPCRLGTSSWPSCCTTAACTATCRTW